MVGRATSHNTQRGGATPTLQTPDNNPGANTNAIPGAKTNTVAAGLAGEVPDSGDIQGIAVIAITVRPDWESGVARSAHTAGRLVPRPDSDTTAYYVFPERFIRVHTRGRRPDIAHARLHGDKGPGPLTRGTRGPRSDPSQ
ncbi:hypothetical protein LSAT2_004511 [Lamellibrachia satsuma]|nr:hypothetical protein LSAT2_004511 [Lamellibrachia satsuma]